MSAQALKDEGKPAVGQGADDEWRRGRRTGNRFWWLKAEGGGNGSSRRAARKESIAQVR